MGRFKWLEVDGGAEKKDQGVEKKNKDEKHQGRAVLSGSKRTGAGAPDRDAEALSQFGKTDAPDEKVFDADHFKSEAFRLYQAGDFNGAMLHFSKCLSENNKDEEAWLYQTHCQIQLEKYEDALIWAKRAYEFFGMSADAQGMLGLVHALTSSDPERGLSYSDGAVAKNKPNFFMWQTRGEILLRSGNVNTAFVCFKNAASFLNPILAKNHDFEIAMALLRSKRYPQALSHFKKAVQAGICNFFIYEKIAAVCEKLEFLDEAEFYYKLSLDMRPSHEPSQTGIGRVREQNTFIIRLFNRIYKFFKLGGQPNGAKTRD